MIITISEYVPFMLNGTISASSLTPPTESISAIFNYPQSYNEYFSIEEITVKGRAIHFSKPLNFIAEFNRTERCFEVNDDFISIHEIGSTLDEVEKEVKADLELQWECIVMADDKNLYKDAIELKHYLLSKV